MKRVFIAVVVLSALAFSAQAQKSKTNKIQKPQTTTQKTINAVQNNNQSSSSKACPGTNGLTQAEIDSILSAHNKARAEVGAPQFQWNCRLAEYAQEWAQRGVAEHRDDGFYGENLFVSITPTISPVSGVENWLLEKPFWNNSTATCQAGKVCTHYTQIVWKKSSQLGCGINRSVAAGKWKVLMVCNYDPAGNKPGKAF